MNKISHPTCLSNYRDSLRVSSSEIEGGRGLPLDSNYKLGQFQHSIKSAKLLCGDNDILNNFTPQLFPPSRQECQ